MDLDKEEQYRGAWMAMIETGCYNDHPQAFFKAIDALFDAGAIDIDVRDELIATFSASSKSSG